MGSEIPDDSRAIVAVNGLTTAVLGDTAAARISELYTTHAAEAHAMARGFLGDAHLAQDAVHTAYVTILRRLLRGWMWSNPDEARATVMLNTRWAALNLVRSARRARAHAGDAPEAETDAWAQSEARVLVERIVGQLHPRQREVLHLRYVEQLPAHEAASRLGMTDKAYTGLLERAMRAARRLAAGGTAASVPALIAASRRWLRRSPSRRISRGAAHWRSVPGPGVRLGAVVASTVGLFGAVQALAIETVAPSLSTASVVVSGTPVAHDADTIDTTFVVDVAVASRSAPPSRMVALGIGQRCACWLVLATADGGASWHAAVLPLLDSISPRVAVSPSYPSDPRVAILLSPGRELVGDVVGDTFVARAGATPPLQPRPRIPCVRAAPDGIWCLGRKLASEADDAPSVGTSVDLGGGWLVYLRPSGGLTCSHDGTGWGRTCRVDR